MGPPILGSALGSAVDPNIGGPIGKFLGGKIGHLAESVCGFGEYKVRHNSIMFGGMDPPIVANTVNRGGTVIRHREYIGDIVGSIEFNVRKFVINPGSKKTFPWLAEGPAKSYEIYRLQGMLFEFVSTSSDAVLSDSTNSSLGTINLATDYDALDEPYPDKVSMLNSEFSNSTKPSVNCIHPIECKKSLTPVTEMYIRTDDDDVDTPNQDPRLNDIGNFYIATEGQQADGGTLGELWVTYEVFLMKTQLKDECVSLSDYFTLSGVTNSAWLNGAVQDEQSTLFGEITTNNTYNFTSDYSGKNFLFTLFFSGSSTATIGEISLGISGGAPVQIFGSGANYLQAPPGGATAQYVMYEFVVGVTDPVCTVTFNTIAPPGGTVTGSFLITEVPFTAEAVDKKKKKPRKRRII